MQTPGINKHRMARHIQYLTNLDLIPMCNFNRTSKGLYPDASSPEPREGDDEVWLSGQIVAIEMRQGPDVLIDCERTENEPRPNAPKKPCKDLDSSRKQLAILSQPDDSTMNENTG